MIRILKQASKLFDFIFFPQIKFQYHKVLEEYGEAYQAPYRELEAFLSTISDTSSLDYFYHEHFFIYYPIFQWIPPTKYSSIEDFLQALLDLDEETIQAILAKSLEMYSQNPLKENWIDLLKQLPIEDAIKWHIHIAYCFPKETMQNYVSVMKEILPRFENIYNHFFDETFFLSMEEKINKEGIDFFLSIWKNYYDDKENITLAQAEKIQSVIISYASPLTASLGYPRLGDNFYILGRHLDEYKESLFNVRFSNAEHLVLFFKNLADPSRFRVLMEVAKGNGSNMHIAKKLGISPATTSYHLMSLSDSNFIYRDKEEKGIVYRLHHPGIRKGLQAFLKYLDYIEKESKNKSN